MGPLTGAAAGGIGARSAASAAPRLRRGQVRGSRPRQRGRPAAIAGNGRAAGAVGAGGAARRALRPGRIGIGGSVAQAALRRSRARAAAGGVLGFLNRNPLLLSGVMKGIGGALQSRSHSTRAQPAPKTATTSQRVPALRRRRLDDLQSAGRALQHVIYGHGQYEYDPNSGRILPKREARHGRNREVAAWRRGQDPNAQPQPGDGQSGPTKARPQRRGRIRQGRATTISPTSRPRSRPPTTSSSATA
jgi:hypothetical protein